eukprot:Phypoly_transcript_04542.p1 GENE.Phypoly_transcript_04542~~Phypoly_transcript_04542.p1  ORF type:complete len:703 (+),score=199.52 Phypoly_transcript_04542:40-2109(+)
MKRKDLQKLAKKYGLKANAKNEDIIRDLSEIFAREGMEAEKIEQNAENDTKIDTMDEVITTTTITTETNNLKENGENDVENGEIKDSPPSPTLQPAQSLYPVLSPLAGKIKEPTSPRNISFTESDPVPLYPALSSLVEEKPIKPATTQTTSESEMPDAPSTEVESEQITVEQATTTTEQISTDQAVTDQDIMEQSTTEQITIDQPSTEQATTGQLPTEQIPASNDQTSSQQTSTVKAPAVEKVVKKVTIKKDAHDDSRRQEIMQNKRITRAETVKAQKTRKSVLATVSNKVSGLNRPTAPKVRPSKETAAKALATQKAKENTKKRAKIDFDKIHAKQFNSMASIADHQKNKDSRALDFLGFSKPKSASESTPAADVTNTKPVEVTNPAPSATTTPAAPKSKAFSFKPPPATESTNTQKGSTKNSTAPTPSKPTTSAPAKTPKAASTPARPTFTTSKPVTPAAVSRLVADAKKNTISVPSFVPPPPAPLPTPHIATNPTTSVFLSVKDISDSAKTPKQKPKPLFSSKTPLRPVSDKPPVSAKRAKPAATLPTPASTTSTASNASSSTSTTTSASSFASTSASSAFTSASTSTSTTSAPATTTTSTTSTSPAAEPPKKKTKSDKAHPYVPHTGPLPKFEAVGFSSFSSTPFKVAPKPKYDAKKSLVSAKKTPKRAAAANNKENTENNSLVC